MTISVANRCAHHDSMRGRIHLCAHRLDRGVIVVAGQCLHMQQDGLARCNGRRVRCREPLRAAKRS